MVYYILINIYQIFIIMLVHLISILLYFNYLTKYFIVHFLIIIIFLSLIQSNNFILII